MITQLPGEETPAEDKVENKTPEGNPLLVADDAVTKEVPAQPEAPVQPASTEVEGIEHNFRAPSVTPPPTTVPISSGSAIDGLRVPKSEIIPPSKPEVMAETAPPVNQNVVAPAQGEQTTDEQGIWQVEDEKKGSGKAVKVIIIIFIIIIVLAVMGLTYEISQGWNPF